MPATCWHAGGGGGHSGRGPVRTLDARRHTQSIGPAGGRDVNEKKSSGWCHRQNRWMPDESKRTKEPATETVALHPMLAGHLVGNAAVETVGVLVVVVVVGELGIVGGFCFATFVARCFHRRHLLPLFK